MKATFVAAFVTLAALIQLSVLTIPSVQGAADQLFVQQSCSAGAVSITFRWQGNDPTATQQWLDLSLTDDGWQPGSAVSAGPLSASQVSYTWPGLVPNATYFVRLNQQLADGSWDPSPTFAVQAIGCELPVAAIPQPQITIPGPAVGLPPNVTINVVDCATASPPLRILLGC